MYADRIAELPLGDLDDKSVWVGEPGAAPSRATAKNKKYMNPCDFEIVLKPKVDYKTGKAITKPNSKGEEVIQYKFIRVTKVFKYPPMSFTDPAQAVLWAVNTGVYASLDEATKEYDRVKEAAKPANAAAMWKNWVAVVNAKLEDND